MQTQHTIDSQTYTKGELIARVQQTLKTAHELKDDEYAIALYLLGLRGKSVTGRPRIAVKNAFVAYKPHNCLHFMDSDGKWVDFSYIKALDSPRQLSVRKVNAALRDAIQPQIDLYRCENHVAAKKHIDHVIPFKQLVKNFLSSESKQFSDLRVSKKTGRDRWDLMPLATKERWIAYHQQHAKLEAVEAYVQITK